MNIQNRTIYCKDNLDILKGIDSETVDMIYLDPPFNSKKQWNAPIGSIAEGATFKDTWTTDDIKEEWIDTIHDEYPELHTFLNSFKLWGAKSDVAYITYMSVRIIECHRVLKSTGTLFYHCDHVMNDYVKIMLDIIFGRDHDINNIVWCYTGGGISKDYFGKKHDNIFWYRKSSKYTFNLDDVRIPYKESAQFRTDDDGRLYSMKNGKKYYKNPNGKIPQDWWSDIQPLHPVAKERCGYPTQKPLTLLSRIIKASTNEGDLVLDPFCGCATTCVAAHKLGRQWIGIDISPKAFELVTQRIKDDANDLFNHDPIRLELNAPVRSQEDAIQEQQTSEERKRRAHTIYVRETVYERDGGKCVNCGSKEQLEYDHIIPFSKGGSDDVANTQILCKKCNLKKSNKAHS